MEQKRQLTDEQKKRNCERSRLWMQSPANKERHRLCEQHRKDTSPEYRKQIQEYAHAYYLQPANRTRIIARACLRLTVPSNKERRKQLTATPAYRQYVREYSKCYRAIPANRERANKYATERSAVDLNFRLRRNLRGRLVTAMRRCAGGKAGSAVSDLGCTIDELRLHLERQFQLGMTWENYGKLAGKWNIDHHLPLASFDLTERSQFLIACHYTNLVPMWAEENWQKKDKVPASLCASLPTEAVA